MSQPIELPDGFDPRVSVQADMDNAADYDSLLKLHGVSRAGQFRPASPWDSRGRLRTPGAPPPGPRAEPANGGIRP